MLDSFPSFEELKKLHEEDPEALEALNQAWNEKIISSAPESHQQRLRGLLFQMDMERRRATTSLSASIRLYTMMTESFVKLCDIVEGLYEDGTNPLSDSTEVAKVVPLRPSDPD